jgi:hypothetical protein
MTRGQPSKSIKRQKLPARTRVAAGVVFAVVAAGAVLLWFSARGTVDLGLWLGKCGFQQRWGLPCPGCGWTHAGQAFFTGHPIEAFRIQPAAAFFSVAAVLAALFALHCALFGIDFGFLSYLFQSAGISILLISAIVVILAGWAVTFIRAMLENSGN